MTDISESHADFYRRWHRLASAYFDWQFDYIRPYLGARVTDIGCGPGNHTRYLLDRELYVGVDRDAAMLQDLAREFPAENVRTICGDITLPGVREQIMDLAVDTVLALGVLPQIERDREALAGMVDLLPPGGTIVVLVPALQWLHGSLDELDGVYRRYDKAMLGRYFAEAGVDTLSLRYFNFVGAFGWWLKARLLRQRRHADSNYIVMSRLVPILRALEQRIEPPIGMTLIGAGRKR